jgi:hypothetical protein
MKHPLAPRLAALALGSFAFAAQAGGAPAVSDAWARATPPGVDVGAAYMVIQGGDRPDRLVAASSDRAAMVHLHTVEEQADVAKMRAIDAIEVPARGRVVLAPKSTHLMLMGLTAPLVAGQSFPITLRFATAGPLTVTVTVREATAGADHSRHDH